MKYLLFLLFFIFFLIFLIIKIETPVKVVTYPTITPFPIYIPKYLTADNLFQLVNSWRIENGYQPYKKSDFTCNIASIRLPEISKNFSHFGFNAKRFCNDTCYIAENLAKGFIYENETPQLLDTWLKSASHAANLKANYTHSCIRCNQGYCVHIFSYF